MNQSIEFHQPVMPPCQAACPIHQDAQGYIKSVAAGDFQAAAQIILKDNPLPGTLGRICAHPCTDVCTRGDLDEAIHIPGLKRFVMDNHPDYTLPKPEKERSEKIAVIGSGPAGLMCAYKLRQQGYQVTIFEALPVAGGMMRVGIPDFRLPPQILDDEIQKILDTGIKIKLNTQIGRDIKLIALQKSYKAIFISIGAHIDQKLGVVGEELPGVKSGIDFLRRVNLGEDINVGCRVLVVGGGNSATDVARTAKRMGADVSIVYRRTRDEMPADRIEVKEAEEEGISLRLLASPACVIDKGATEALECHQMQLGEPDESGRPRPVPVDGEDFELECEDILVTIGQKPDVHSLNDCLGLDLSSWDTFTVDPITKETNVPGLFAGGDCVTGPSIVVLAMREGMEAAKSIDRYCNGVDLREGRSDQYTSKGEVLADKKIELTKNQIEIPHITLEERETFKEVVTGYSPEQAREEAFRCVNFILPESVVQHQNTIESIKVALKEGMGTVEEIAGNTSLPEKEVFWHLVAMTKYGDATYQKQAFDCFTYALKED